MTRILPIVEGHGDLKAVPLLLRRLAAHHELHDIQILHPHRRGDLPKMLGNFEKYFRMALLENAAILWILDFDCAFCDCVVKESKKLYERAEEVRKDWPFKVSFIVQEYESFFLAEQNAAISVLGLDEETDFPPDPEGPRNAKGWLSSALPKGSSYKETIHQEKITARLNLDELRVTSASFRHLEKSFLSLAKAELPA